MTTLTANLATLVGGVLPKRAQLVITAPAVKDTANNILFTGGLTVAFDSAGKLSTTLLATDTADTDPVEWQYGFEVKWEGGSLTPFYAEVTGDTIDLSDLQVMDETDPVYLPVTIPQSRVIDLEDDLGELAAALSAMGIDIAALTSGKQPLSTMLTDLAALAATLTDGQLIKWDFALGKPVAMNPIGQSELVKATNATGTLTAVSSVAVVIANTTIPVPNSNGRPVKLEFSGTFQQNVAGTGSIWFAIEETTSGSTYRRYNKKPLPGTTTANVNQVSLGTDTLDIGVVTTTRTFRLAAVIMVATGTPSGVMINNATQDTTLRAVAG